MRLPDSVNSSATESRIFAYDAFLSYNKAQKDWVRELARRLRKDSFRVWFDEWEMPKSAGRNWIDALAEGVEQSRKVVLVWSPEFFASEWPEFESNVIQQMDPTGRKERVIPVIHTNSKPPRKWGFRQALDFSFSHTDPIEFEFHYHHLLFNLDNTRRYEPDFERFKDLYEQGNADRVPPFSPVLPKGSRMRVKADPRFVGREEELLVLARTLAPTGKATARVQIALTGLGGVGKTQLAVQYVHRYGYLYPGGIFWLNLAKAEDATSEVARCGGSEGMDLSNFREMKLPEQAARVQRVWEESETPKLLVFDNPEDPAIVEQWRPITGRCSLLITSRRAEWPTELGVTTVAVGTLPREKSLDLLAAERPTIRSDSAEGKAANEICERFGDLPLALVLTAAYLGRYKSEEVTDYLGRLGIQSVIEDRSLEGVELCFALSYQKLISDRETDALAQRLFFLASHFAPLSIARELLAAAAGLDAAKLEHRNRTDDAIRRLQELGLIREEAGGRVSLHQLLREFARVQVPKEINSVEANAAVAQVLLQLAAHENAGGLPQKLTKERTHLRQVAQEAERLNPAIAASLYNEVGFHGRIVALFQESKADHERALKLGEAHFGPDHPKVAVYASNLGLVLHELGNIKEAKKCYERALQIDEAFYNADDPAIARDLSNVARVLWQVGNRDTLTDARIHLERSVSIIETAYGKEHPNVAPYANNLGDVLREIGDVAEARACYERALKLDENTYGANHPLIAVRISNIGLVLHDLGELTAAETSFKRALGMAEAAYGPDHPQVAIHLNKLGLVLKDLGECGDAEKALNRALKINEAVYGQNHPEVAIVLESLGLVYLELSNLGGAHSCFERALQINKLIYGGNDRRVAADLNNLGRIFWQSHCLLEAKDSCQKALAIGETIYGLEHQEVSIYLKNLGRVLAELGEWKEAKICYERTLRIKEGASEPDDLEVASIVNHLGRILKNLGDLKAARTYYERAFTAFKTRLGESHAYTMKARISRDSLPQ